MVVVDTSAWIEWIDDGLMAETVRELLPARHDCVVPTIVQLELAKWLTREATDLSRNATLAYLSRCIVAPMDTEIAFLAAEFCATAKLSTADAIIYATATHYGADLLTCDGHFKDLPRVVYVAKRAA